MQAHSVRVKQGDGADGSDRCHDGHVPSSQHPRHSGHGRQEGGRHLRPLHVSASEHERRDVRRQQRLSLEGVRSDSRVLGEHDPSTGADRREPVDISRVGRERIIVHDYCVTSSAQRAGDERSSQGPIDEKGEGLS